MLFEYKYEWCQKFNAVDKFGDSVPSLDPYAARWCIMGKLFKHAKDLDQYFAWIERVKDNISRKFPGAYHEYMEENNNSDKGLVPWFNDKVSFESVKQVTDNIPAVGKVLV